MSTSSSEPQNRTSFVKSSKKLRVSPACRLEEGVVLPNTVGDESPRRSLVVTPLQEKGIGKSDTDVCATLIPEKNLADTESQRNSPGFCRTTGAERAFVNLKIKPESQTQNREGLKLTKDQGIPPHSPKKRKANTSLLEVNSTTQKSDKSKCSSVNCEEVSHGAVGGKSTQKGSDCEEQADLQNADSYSLRDLLVQFGHIELNRDLYESIDRTESRSGHPSTSDLRENDRLAFERALVRVKDVLRYHIVEFNKYFKPVQYKWKGSEEAPEHGNIKFQLFMLTVLALRLLEYVTIQGTSSGSFNEATFEHSATELTSNSENMPVQKLSSDQQSLQSQRKVSDQENSQNEEAQQPDSHLQSLIHHGKHARQTENSETCGVPRPSVSQKVCGAQSVTWDEKAKRQKKDVRVSYTESDVQQYDVESAEEDGEERVHNPGEARSTNSDILDQNKAGFILYESGCELILPQNDASLHQDDLATSGLRSQKRTSRTWGSSLVCADLSLNEVGSKVFWPFLASMKTGKDLASISAEEHSALVDSHLQENIPRVSQALDDAIFSVYSEFDGVKISSGIKAAIIAGAFENIINELNK